MIYKLNIDAFAASPSVRSAMEQAREDRDLAKSRVNVFDGGMEAAIGHYAEHPTPQVVLVEETGDDQKLLDDLGRLAEVCEPGTRVIVIGQLNDISLYRQLISQGVSEYLVAPVTAHQVLDCIRTIFADPAAPPRGKMLAFIGARGGVGASTLAQNVAWHIAGLIADDVIYVDLDLPFGSSSLAFNVDSKQTIADALGQPERVDAVLMERFLVKYGDHLQVLMSSANLRGHIDIDIDGVEKVLEVARQMAPFVVVDLPHLWSPWTEALARSADDLVIVATPDLGNLRETKSLVEQVAAKRESLPTRVVLNRVDAYKKTQLSAKDFQETLGFAPALSIPFDPNLFGTAANNGQMLSEAAKGHKIVESLKQFAVQMTGRQAAAKKPASVLGWLKMDLKTKKRA